VALSTDLQRSVAQEYTPLASGKSSAEGVFFVFSARFYCIFGAVGQNLS
jgi:hypothetical protein